MPCERRPELQNRVQIIGAGTLEDQTMNPNQRRWCQGFASHSRGVHRASRTQWTGIRAPFQARLSAYRPPYAIPTASGATNGSAYLRGTRNTGDQPDRLFGGPGYARRSRGGDPPRHHRCPKRHAHACDRGHRTAATSASAAAPRWRVPPDVGRLIDLKQSLKDGDRFPMTLRFERAGDRRVMVWVQTPRGTRDSHRRQHQVRWPSHLISPGTTT